MNIHICPNCQKEDAYWKLYTRGMAWFAVCQYCHHKEEVGGYDLR